MKHRGSRNEQDLRFVGPVHQCLCGSTMFIVHVQFMDYEPSWWGLDAHCAKCNALVKVPCPADKEESL
jgi:hypothetical protein